MSNSRIISFSYKPGDTKAKEQIDYLKTHADKQGLNFSYLVIKAITKLNEEIKANVQ